MKYFSLHHQYANTGFIDGDVNFSPPLANYYQIGTQLPLQGRTVSVSMDKAVRKLKVDFFLTTSGAFFASENLSTLLKLHQPDLHTVAATTQYHSGRATEKSYRLVHANTLLECFDYQKSQYAGKSLVLQRLERGDSPENIMVKGIQSIAIDESRAEGANFFFLKNVLLIDPIVSQSLAEAIQQNDFLLQIEEL